MLRMTRKGVGRLMGAVFKSDGNRSLVIEFLLYFSSLLYPPTVRIMNRRSFLQQMAASGLLVGLPVFGTMPGSPDWHRYSRPDLLAIIDDADSVREIGRAYRRLFPAHNDVQTLGLMLQAETNRLALPSKIPADRLSQCVQADFAHGRTVQIKGWILSITEARQCALFSLLSS